MPFHITGDALWQHIGRAVEKVQERLERTAAILEQAGILYAIISSNAVRAWVAQADEAVIRTTRDVWPSSTCRHFPVPASHTRTVLSSEPEITCRPSDDHATLQTRFVWPSSTRRQTPLATSQMRTMLSSDAEMASRLSGLNATDRTALV